MMKLSLMSRVVATINEEHSSPLAHEIASRWFKDIKKVIYWRASSNFIFEVVTKQDSYVLRFNSINERSVDLIKAEVEVLNYLNDNGFSVCKPLKSLTGNYYELVDSNLGTFIAMVYKRIAGVMFEYHEINEQQLKLWGAELGKLHSALQNQVQLHNRPNWQDLMGFIKEHIKNNETQLLNEYHKIYEALSKLPVNENNYGLIHFDFETDNIIFNNNEISIIDFDDMCVLWFAADILYAVRSMFANEKIDITNKDFNRFIESYKLHKEVSDEELTLLPLFMRFHRLYLIARLRRSLDITDFSQHPKWIEKLSNKVQQNYIQSSIRDIENKIIHIR